MSAFGGTKLSVGHGLWVANVSTSAGTDVDDAAVEPTGTKCKLMSISMATNVAAVSVLAIKDAELNLFIQSPCSLTGNYSVVFAENGQPELDGLTFDTPTIGASAVMGFSVVYQK